MSLTAVPGSVLVILRTDLEVRARGEFARYMVETRDSLAQVISYGQIAAVGAPQPGEAALEDVGVGDIVLFNLSDSGLRATTPYRTHLVGQGPDVRDNGERIKMHHRSIVAKYRGASEMVAPMPGWCLLAPMRDAMSESLLGAGSRLILPDTVVHDGITERGNLKKSPLGESSIKSITSRVIATGGPSLYCVGTCRQCGERAHLQAEVELRVGDHVAHSSWAGLEWALPAGNSRFLYIKDVDMIMGSDAEEAANRAA